MTTCYTPESFRSKLSPMFDGVCDEAIQEALDDAALFISESNWSARYCSGVLLLAAHWVTEFEMLINAGSVAASASAIRGEISSEKIKSWSASYGNGNSGGVFDGDALATTSWGKAFIAKRNLIFSCRKM